MVINSNNKYKTTANDSISTIKPVYITDDISVCVYCESNIKVLRILKGLTTFYGLTLNESKAQIIGNHKDQRKSKENPFGIDSLTRSFGLKKKVWLCY